jgi:hypothetical protein
MKYLKVSVVEDAGEEDAEEEDAEEEDAEEEDALEDVQEELVEDTGEEVVGATGIILIPGIMLHLFGTILPLTGSITERVLLVV